MVLGKLPVPRRPSCLEYSRARGMFGHFILSSIISLFFLPLFGRRPDID